MSGLNVCNWCGMSDETCGDEACPLSTRAAPDVPELVRYTVVCQYHEDDGHPYADTFKHANGEYVLHSQAAEIIAALTERLKNTEAAMDSIIDERIDSTKRAESAEAKLAQYEAQEPVVYVDENGMAAFTLGGISTVHTQFETSKSERFFFPLYASPAPAADLKADNERLREALTKISSPTQTAGLLWWQVEARAALNSENQP